MDSVTATTYSSNFPLAFVEVDGKDSTKFERSCAFAMAGNLYFLPHVGLYGADSVEPFESKGGAFQRFGGNSIRAGESRRQGIDVRRKDRKRLDYRSHMWISRRRLN